MCGGQDGIDIHKRLNVGSRLVRKSRLSLTFSEFSLGHSIPTVKILLMDTKRVYCKFFEPVLIGYQKIILISEAQ